MHPFKRSERVARELQRVVNSYLRKELDRDESGIVTITDASISEDLKHAQIFYSVYGTSEDKEKTAELFKRILPAIRKHVGSKIRLRFTPEIMFKYDSSVEYAAKIEDLIDRIHRETGGNKDNEKRENDSGNIEGNEEP